MSLSLSLSRSLSLFHLAVCCSGIETKQIKYTNQMSALNIHDGRPWPTKNTEENKEHDGNMRPEYVLDFFLCHVTHLHTVK